MGGIFKPPIGRVYTFKINHSKFKIASYSSVPS
jgi:hypothetical protein